MIDHETAEAEIRDAIARWSRAAEAKDPDAIVADYAADAVLFDAVPPHRTAGAKNIRDAWARRLPFFPAEFRSEHEDLDVTICGDLAVVAGFHRFVPTPADHPCGAMLMRVTVAMRREEGRWRVFHEHVSAPFDPMTGAVVRRSTQILDQ